MKEIGIGISTDINVKIERVFKGFSSMVKHQISLVSSLDTNIDFLKQSLPIMKDFMLNAEVVILNKEMSSQISSCTKQFVKALKQFICDGEEIIDKFEIEVLDRGHKNFEGKSKIASKMKKLYDSFEDLKEKKQGSSLQLSRKPSISMIQRADFKMVGRDEDRKWLLHELLGNKSSPSVVLLTGMAGIGKTTLAHDIFYDPKIVKHFAFRKWVTLEDRDLDPKKVLNQIKAHENIRSSLDGKKRFLIVVDDIWEVEDLNHRWNELWVPLSCGDKGSRVIVTAREENVKCRMEGLHVEVKKLGLLNDEECQNIFETFAFPDVFNMPSSSSSSPPISLREKGKHIVHKMVKGIPLVASVMGSGVRGKEYMYWNDALAQIKERDIGLAILWSYLNLSVHLKHCFVYCSLYLKGTSFDKNEIVSLWMKKSFFSKLSTQHNGGMTLVDIGESYVDALVNASLLEVVEDDDDNHEYMMHDLIHDFALNIRNHWYSKKETTFS